MHIWSMATLATSPYATRLPLPPSLTSAPEAPFTKILDFTSLAPYIVLFGIASFTNRGPKAHFPPERLYSAKTLSSSASTVHANVTGYVRESIYSVLLFACTTPVVMLGYRAVLQHCCQLHSYWSTAVNFNHDAPSPPPSPTQHRALRQNARRERHRVSCSSNHRTILVTTTPSTTTPATSVPSSPAAYAAPLPGGDSIHIEEASSAEKRNSRPRFRS
ncbi:hypothetical protein FRC04_006571 [Tulasnella sp. 424]|nr:hypothetical protein FRC04_006571 [Tulasnella sp. 424]KAG8960980.1 hypothetical protein FRC05_006418 [Tulasnella sp. 425]